MNNLPNLANPPCRMSRHPRLLLDGSRKKGCVGAKLARDGGLSIDEDVDWEDAIAS
jgi:hypothetical protein